MTAFVDDYVRQVEAACADLPPDQRRRLVADLAAHLREIDTATGNVYAELGPPDRYARELREALDLPLPVSPGSTDFGPPRLVVAAGTRRRRAPDVPWVPIAIVVVVVLMVVAVVLAP